MCKLFQFKFHEIRCMLSLSCVDERKVQDDWTLIIMLTYDIKEIDNYLARSQYRKNYVEISVGYIQKKNHHWVFALLKGHCYRKIYFKSHGCYTIKIKFKK